MKRRWKVLITAVALLAVLLAVNAVVVASETKPARATASGAEIVELDSVDLQVLDQPADAPNREGAPIVLLHCYACSLRWWDALAPLLNAEHRVIRFDLIGFGGSQKPQSGYSIPEQARAVAEGLSELGVGGAVLVGHSMGGEVATAVAEVASELVDRVAVIATPAATEHGELPFVARATYAPVIGEALWRVRPNALIRRGYESAFAPGFDFEAAFADPDQVVEDNRAMTYTSYERAAAEADEFTDRGTVTSRIAATGIPFLAILGAEDQIVDTPAAEASFAAVPGATVRVLEGSGHSPNVEVPGETAELLLRFAGAAPTPARSDRPPRAGSADRRRLR